MVDALDATVPATDSLIVCEFPEVVWCTPSVVSVVCTDVDVVGKDLGDDCNSITLVHRAVERASDFVGDENSVSHL